MTLLADMRAAMPGLRDALPDMREAIPDLREFADLRDRGPTVSDIRQAMPDLRAVLPDAREAIPAIRGSLSDLRADVPGPWRRERPSVLGRIAVVVLAGGAIAIAAWLLMAFLERRRLSRRGPPEADQTAVERAEREGMGTAVAEPAGVRSAGSSSASVGIETSESSARPGIDMDAIRPLVSARTVATEGGTTDGR
ncbi:MAG TPA: hypothetical protein VMT36_00455 [Candidatus Saccharimonadia bacterium]|nr:hypothetical protein [Candidatus Saccharimonadia bacterium]